MVGPFLDQLKTSCSICHCQSPLAGAAGVAPSHTPFLGRTSRDGRRRKLHQEPSLRLVLGECRNGEAVRIGKLGRLRQARGKNDRIQRTGPGGWRPGEPCLQGAEWLRRPGSGGLGGSQRSRYVVHLRCDMGCARSLLNLSRCLGGRSCRSTFQE